MNSGHEVPERNPKSQAKRFFAALCFASKNLSVFEKQLVGLPEEDWPIVLLAGIIIENCGLARIKDEFMIASQSDREYWVPVPNQYILQDQAWLFPVIRACDPERKIFTEHDHGLPLFESLSEKLDISMKTKDKTILVDLRHCLTLVAQLLSQPSALGVSEAELNSVLKGFLTEDLFHIVQEKKQHIPQWYRENEEPHKLTLRTDYDELYKSIMALAFMIALFVTTGLIFGSYCRSTTAGRLVDISSSR